MDKIALEFWGIGLISPKMNRLIITFIFCLSFLALHAQTIDMHWPAFAGRTYDFIIFQGSVAEKISQDTIPADGRFQLVIPETYAPYTGMSRWLITNSQEGGGLDMAIPGHGFSVSCATAEPSNENIIYKGFDPVNELNRLHEEQQQIIDKFEAIKRAATLYKDQEKLHKLLMKEAQNQQSAYVDFRARLKKNPNFNARFLPIVTLVNGYNHQLSDNYDTQMQLFNDYVVHQMDYNDLYVSGYWAGIIHNWVVMHVNNETEATAFAELFNTISLRIEDPEQYTDFVGKITYYLNQFGKDNLIQAIAPTVLNSGKIITYQGNTMQVYVNAIVGSQAPDLVITEHIGKVEDHKHKTTVFKSNELAAGEYHQTLLVFYKSGCGPCEALMAELPQRYEGLKKQGIRVVSISADEEETLYKNSSNYYPWPDKYCDFKGLGGINFKNYAVQGTPTLFLIDEEGKIRRRGARLEGVLD